MSKLPPQSFRGPCLRAATADTIGFRTGPGRLRPARERDTALVGLRPREPRRIACSISSKVQRRSSAGSTRCSDRPPARRNRSGNRRAARMGRISAAPPRPALCDCETTPQSRRAAPARVTGSQPEKMGRLIERGELGFDDARARTPTGGGIAAGRRRLRPSRSAPSARRRARQPSTHADRC